MVRKSTYSPRKTKYQAPTVKTNFQFRLVKIPAGKTPEKVRSYLKKNLKEMEKYKMFADVPHEPGYAVIRLENQLAEGENPAVSSITYIAKSNGIQWVVPAEEERWSLVIKRG